MIPKQVAPRSGERREYPRELSLDAVHAQLDLLASEEARPSWNAESASTLLTHGQRAVELWMPHGAGNSGVGRAAAGGGVLSNINGKWMGGLRRNLTAGRGQPGEEGAASALARFASTLPAALEPAVAAACVSGALFASRVPCFWAAGGRVLDCQVLETLGPAAWVMYQLVRCRDGKLVDACYVSCHRVSRGGQADAGGVGAHGCSQLVGQWTVEHPLAPPQQPGVQRRFGLVAFVFRGSVDGTAPHRVSGICQMPGMQQSDALLSFFDKLGAFAASAPGREYAEYLENSLVPGSALLGDMVTLLWRWASDEGLWVKGRNKSAKVWRSGRPGSLARGIRFQGTIAKTHAGTLAQVLFNPDVKKGLQLGSGHKVERIRVLEASGSSAKIIHVEETMAEQRRDYCVLSCLASVGSDTWLVCEWSVDHIMAPRTKKVSRILLKTAFLISAKDEGDTMLLVATERVADRGTGSSLVSVEQELEDLPYGFSAALSGWLHSDAGRAALAEGGCAGGLRGAAMHGRERGPAGCLLRTLPSCVLDALDAVACCRPQPLRVRPSVYA